MTRFYRYSYVINGYGVRRGTRESPTYFSIVGCVYGFWGVQWRDREIKNEVRKLYDRFQDDYRLIIHVHAAERIGVPSFPRYAGEETVQVPSHESVGLGFYRGYAQVELKGRVEVMEKSDLRYRYAAWRPAAVGFECPAPAGS